MRESRRPCTRGPRPSPLPAYHAIIPPTAGAAPIANTRISLLAILAIICYHYEYAIIILWFPSADGELRTADISGYQRGSATAAAVFPGPMATGLQDFCGADEIDG